MTVTRVPQQARSRALVARILDAAGELFASEGYSATTTNRIAMKADVSVGSLYQFFADKQAVLAALQADWATRLGDALDESLLVDDERELSEIVDSVLEVHARIDAEQPGLLAVLLTSHAGTRQITSVRDAVQERLERIIGARSPGLPAAERRIAAAMLIHLSLGLYAIPRSIDPARTGVRAEVRRALVAYLEALYR